MGAGAAGAAPALWLVRDADSEIYLFGTLHALQPGLPWRTPAYDAAYARADAIWFEADLGEADPQKVGELIARYGVDPERGLSSKLAPADLKALARQADIRRIDHLRPWAAALMLSMQPTLGRGATLEGGVDLAVTRTAHAQAKPVRAFETLEDQARMFAGLPEGAEVQYLTDVIRERGRGPRLSLKPGGGSLQHAWLAGDLGRLGPELVGEMRDENPALYEALLKRRNLTWADALSREMAGAGTQLVNVGALHMLGDDGLPALMRARGFEVTRIQ